MEDTRPAETAGLSATQCYYIWNCYRLSGDPELKDRLLQHYAPLIRRVVKGHLSVCPYGMEAQDVESYAVMSFLEALEHYDPGGNPNFEAYITCWIRGGILHGIRLFRGTKRERPVFVRMQETDGSSLLDRIPDPDDPMERKEEQLDRRRLRERLDKEIRKLPARQQDIIRRHYFQGSSLRRIAREMGVSHSWVSYQHRLALFALREETCPDPDSGEEENLWILSDGY